MLTRSSCLDGYDAVAAVSFAGEFEEDHVDRGNLPLILASTQLPRIEAP